MTETVVDEIETTHATKLTRRIVGTFLAPGRLAEDLGDAAPWLDALLISTAIAVASVLAVPDEIFLESMRNAVTMRGEPVEITSPPGVVVGWGRAMSMLATLATHPIIAFVLAGAITVVFSYIGRGSGDFRNYLALASHGLLIPALGTLVAIGFRSVVGVDSPIGSLDLMGDSLPGAMLDRLDPFIFWMLIVVGIGVNRFDRRRAAIAAVGVLLAGYILFVAVTSAFLVPT